MLWKCFACFWIDIELVFAPACSSSFNYFRWGIYVCVGPKWWGWEQGGEKKPRKTQIVPVVLETDGKPSFPPSFCPSGKSVRSSRTYWAKTALLWAPPDRPPSWTWTSRDTSHTSGNTHTQVMDIFLTMFPLWGQSKRLKLVSVDSFLAEPGCSPFWLWPLCHFRKLQLCSLLFGTNYREAGNSGLLAEMSHLWHHPPQNIHSFMKPPKGDVL